MSEEKNEYSHFLGITKWFRRFAAIGFILFASFLIFGSILNSFFKINVASPAISLWVIMAVFFIVYILWAMFAFCPRCKKPFFRRKFFGYLWTDKCLNCGLKL